MAEKTVDKNVIEIRKFIEGKKMVIGTDRTIKNLKLGKISKVYVSSNCSQKVMDSIKHYSKLANAEIVRLKYANDELGTLCRKQFSISVLSVLK